MHVSWFGGGGCDEMESPYSPQGTGPSPSAGVSCTPAVGSAVPKGKGPAIATGASSKAFDANAQGKGSDHSSLEVAIPFMGFSNQGRSVDLYARECINDVAAGLKGSQEQLGTLIGVVTTIGNQFAANQRETKEEVQKTKEEVRETKEEVSVVRGDVSKLQAQMDKLVSNCISSDDGDVFMRFFPLLCDGSTGECGWVPVFHEVAGKEYKVLVLCLAYLERYFSQECPVRKTQAEARAFFTTKLPIHDRLPYEHHQSVLAHKTPFGSNSTGKDGGFTDSQATNRAKFVFLKFDAMKERVSDVFEHMQDVPETRVVDAEERPVGYKAFGQTWKYTQKSRRDFSTTPIKAFGHRVINGEKKKRMLAMNCPWTAENYDRAKVDFFKIPTEWVGRRHVVCGRFDKHSAAVRSHEDVYEGMRMGVVAENRKKAGDADKRKKRRLGY